MKGDLLMAGSTYGTLFIMTTWGIPRAGNRRRRRTDVRQGCFLSQKCISRDSLTAGSLIQSKYTTARSESDQVEISPACSRSAPTGTPHLSHGA